MAFYYQYININTPTLHTRYCRERIYGNAALRMRLLSCRSRGPFLSLSAVSQPATPIFPPAFSIAMLALPSSSFNRGLSQRPGEGDTSSTRLAHLFLYTGDCPVHRVSRPFAIASSSSTLVCYRDRLRPVCVRERVFVYRRLCVCLRVCVRP